MPTIPLWGTGRGVTAYTVRAQEASAGGVLSNKTGSTDGPLVAKWEVIDEDDEETGEDIMPGGSFMHHFVPLAQDGRVTVAEIISGITGGTVLDNLWDTGVPGARWVKITSAAWGKGKVWYGYYTRRSRAIRNGKNVVTGTFVQVDIGEANPVVT